MWARILEFTLACWLAISPFIFRYSAEEKGTWANDFTCAALVAVFALCSFWDPLRKMHLLTLGVALWLWSHGYEAFPSPATIHQENSVVVGLLLLMLAIVPSSSEKLSRSWQEFDQQNNK